LNKRSAAYVVELHGSKHLGTSEARVSVFATERLMKLEIRG
jgi:hypothetical protein